MEALKKLTFSKFDQFQQENYGFIIFRGQETGARLKYIKSLNNSNRHRAMIKQLEILKLEQIFQNTNNFVSSYSKV